MESEACTGYSLPRVQCFGWGKLHEDISKPVTMQVQKLNRNTIQQVQ